PLRYVDEDGRDAGEALVLAKALQRLDRFFSLTQKILEGGKTTLIAAATQMALETLFGKTIAFTSGGLGAPEDEFGKEVQAFEVRGFLGLTKCHFARWHPAYVKSAAYTTSGELYGWREAHPGRCAEARGCRRQCRTTQPGPLHQVDGSIRDCRQCHELCS